MNLDIVTKQVYVVALNEAKLQRHEYFMPEHILQAILFFDLGKEIIESAGGNTKGILEDLQKFFEENIIRISENTDPIETISLKNLFDLASQYATSGKRRELNICDLIATMFLLNDSYVCYILKKNNVDKDIIMKYIYTNDDKGVQEHSSSKQDSQVQGNKEVQEEYIQNFVTDLTLKAQKGEIDPLIGREDAIERTLQVLCRRQKNNPIHVGDPGVGKTAIVEGLAYKIVHNKVPSKLKGAKIYALDISAVLAGTKYRGEFEEKFKGILNYIQKQNNIILYIDEIHNVVGAGSTSGGTLDASNMLKPYLANGKLRFIGSTTFDEYRKFLEKDKALTRRFQKIDILESSVEQTVKILEGLKEKYENYHNIKYTKQALIAAAHLSNKYIQDRYLPDKAVDVIDEAGAFARMNCGDENAQIIINEKDIEKVVSLIAKIPEVKVSKNDLDRLKTLDIELKSEIFGQDNAIDTVVLAIRRSRAGLNETSKPVASLLFVGPTGVGKTEIAKQLSQKLGVSLLRYDMSEYQEKHAVARLIGAPPGYVGYEEGGLLTEAVRKTPHCVLLLDEIEKAHPDLLNILLQIMDYATLTDNNGKKADFSNVILIMTSNAGAKDLGKKAIGFEAREENKSVIEKEVQRFFSPEFRNRLDEIVVFNSMDRSMARLIAKKAIDQLSDKLKPKKINVEITEQALDWLANKGFSNVYGAREIFRIVNKEIKNYFVEELLFGKLVDGGKATVMIKEDKIVISARKARQKVDRSKIDG